MAAHEETMQRLLDAAEHLRKTDVERDAAMRARDDALRAAKAAGATYQEIQTATGMSTPTITKALRRQ